MARVQENNINVTTGCQDHTFTHQNPPSFFADLVQKVYRCMRYGFDLTDNFIARQKAIILTSSQVTALQTAKCTEHDSNSCTTTNRLARNLPKGSPTPPLQTAAETRNPAGPGSLTNEASLSQAGKDQLIIASEKKQDSSTTEANINKNEDQEAEKASLLNQIKKNPAAILNASENLQTDRVFVLKALKENGKVIQHLHPNLKGNEEFAKEAVQINGIFLPQFFKEIQSNLEIVRLAEAQISCRYGIFSWHALGLEKSSKESHSDATEKSTSRPTLSETRSSSYSDRLDKLGEGLLVDFEDFVLGAAVGLFDEKEGEDEV